MKITLTSISPRTRSKSEAAETLADGFISRVARYFPTETLLFPTEVSFFDALDKTNGRTPTHLILLDPRGQLLTSDEFAQHLERQRDAGVQRTLLAIGPADGWSPIARTRAHLLFSLGRITLPHELARAILAEQLYRACTILAGHPYHSGH